MIAEGVELSVKFCCLNILGSNPVGGKICFNSRFFLDLLVWKLLVYCQTVSSSATCTDKGLHSRHSAK